MKYQTSAVLILLFAITSCQEVNDNIKDSEVQEKKEKVILPKYDFDQSFIMGYFQPDSHPDFVKIDPGYTNKTNIYLQKDTYESFLEMHQSAMEAGIELKILSATRNFEAQKSIWEAKWTGRRKIEGGEDLSHDS